MKFAPLVACAVMTVLCACSTSREVAAPVVSGFTPIALASPPANFCQGAATSDRLRAEISGFDAATLDRIAQQSLQQCRTLMAGMRETGFDRLASR